MNARYHVEITQAALETAFGESDLQIIIQANLGQDRLPNLLGHPEIHFDASQFVAGQHYIHLQRQIAVDAIIQHKDRLAALQAFGRLLHGRQDFYAHSNWVRLWVEQQGGLDCCTPDQVEVCLDPLSVPQLISGVGSAWRWILYRIPMLGPLVKRFYLPSNSHEAMNLDHPGRGPLFPFAMAAARKHTRGEFEQLLRQLTGAGGQPAVNLFCGPSRERAP